MLDNFVPSPSTQTMGYTSHINTTPVTLSSMPTRLRGHLGLLPGPKPPLTIRVESIPLLLLIPMTNPTSFTEMGALMEATLPTQKRPAARGQ